MIPLRDSTRSRSSPVVVYSLIAACTGVFVYTWSLEPSAQLAVVRAYGAVPAEVLAGPWPQCWLPLVTSMFLHGGWLHLVGNMLYLWIFGDNVEDAMGHGPFLLFYLLVGVLAGLAHVATHQASAVPLVGASGAIAGVLGAYLILYPGARILTLVFLWVFARFVELPAVLVLSLWFLLQLAEGLMAAAVPGVATVAWWAHVGGFVAGMMLVFPFTRR